MSDFFEMIMIVAVVALTFIFVASPLIFLGWILWLIAN